jgi:hypothetical protein
MAAPAARAAQSPELPSLLRSELSEVASNLNAKPHQVRAFLRDETALPRPRCGDAQRGRACVISGGECGGTAAQMDNIPIIG